MKVGIYLENYIAGGVDTVILNTIENWPNAEDKFVVICNSEADGLNLMLRSRLTRDVCFVISNIVTVHNIYRRFPKLRNILRIMFYYGRHVVFIMNVAILNRLFSKLNMDSIIIHNGGYPGAPSSFSAVIASNLMKINRCAYVIHNIPIPPSPLQLPFDFLYDRIIDRLSRIICVSRAAAERLVSCRFIRQKVLVFHNGISPPPQGDYVLSPRCTDSAFDLTVLGSFDQRKGHRYLFKALLLVIRLFPDKAIKLHLFGKGTDEQTKALEKIVVEQVLEDYVQFHGFVSNVRQALIGMDCLVLPSTGYESLPMVIQEAMSIGLPVIATDVGGVSEMIEDGVSGLVVPPCDANALANAISVLMSDESLKELLGREGRARFDKHFTAYGMAAKYHDLLLGTTPKL